MASPVAVVIGASGGSGPVGPGGPTGPSGTGDTVAISEADTIIVTLTSATVDAANGRPTVTFSLMDGEGNGLDGLQPANVRFTAAKLIPGVERHRPASGAATSRA